VAAVRRALLSLPPPAPSADDDASDSDMDSRASSPSSRRPRRHDAHPTASSSTSYSEHDGEGGARPPSPPPAFDVTKAMLRTRYATLAPKKEPAAAAASQQLEIEVSTEKPRRRITADGGGGGDPKQEAAASEGGGGGGKGPRFADLGGMEAVIAELMMEVVVPLCHPELPRRLGVRPVAGILLHGPPGCGKTTLAHAIANETGVPFYKISAPEVVSGVSGMLSDSMPQNLQNF
jgi:ribosome biogenesis ATPase